MNYVKIVFINGNIWNIHNGSPGTVLVANKKKSKR